VEMHRGSVTGDGYELPIALQPTLAGKTQPRQG
jgi:hypothetical protein